MVSPFSASCFPKQSEGSRISEVSVPQTEETVARPSFLKRLFWFIIDPHVGYFAVYLAAIGVSLWAIDVSLWAIGVSLWRVYKEAQLDAAMEHSHQVLLTLILTLAWPSLVWLNFFFASLVPLEAFVIRDHCSFVARPKQDFKTMALWKQRRGPEVLTGILLILWSAVVLVLAKATDALAR